MLQVCQRCKYIQILEYTFYYISQRNMVLITFQAKSVYILRSRVPNFEKGIAYFEFDFPVSYKSYQAVRDRRQHRKEDKKEDK